MIEVNDSNFQEEVLNSIIPVLIKFYAPWCSPCKAANPKMEKLSELYNNEIKFVEVNIDESFDIPQRFNIRGIPSYALIRNEVTLSSGVLNVGKSIEQLKEQFDEYLKIEQ